MPEHARELRAKLVLTAESVMNKAFERHIEFRKRVQNGGREKDKRGKKSEAEWDKKWKVEKSQLNQLIGVCGEALCPEEIANYLRYQASRERPSWGLELAQHTIASFNEVVGTGLDARAKVDAWRHYAVFLARAFTYSAKVAEPPNARRERENGR